MSHYVVVGAGVAGLTIANQLSARRQAVTVVERDAVVGGLARFWHYRAFHVDVRPHRFHTENPRVSSFIRQILGGDEVFSRVSSPVAVAATMAPEGKSNLCVEVTCRGDDATWTHPESMTARIVADLVRTGTIARAPVLMPLLILGPVMLAALVGAWRGRSRHAGSLAPSLAGIGLPTIVIDTYNAQDIWNRRSGPGGFRWTVVVTPDERRALDWIRKETPLDALVQMEPTVRGRETRTHISTFAHRRMGAGPPISLLRKSAYAEQSARMRTRNGTDDVAETSRLALGLGTDHIYVDATERRPFRPASTNPTIACCTSNVCTGPATSRSTGCCRPAKAAARPRSSQPTEMERAGPRTSGPRPFVSALFGGG
jgi:choline dehydrogenase-like flavoprotein